MNKKNLPVHKNMTETIKDKQEVISTGFVTKNVEVDAISLKKRRNAQIRDLFMIITIATSYGLVIIRTLWRDH